MELGGTLDQPEAEMAGLAVASAWEGRVAGSAIRAAMVAPVDKVVSAAGRFPHCGRLQSPLWGMNTEGTCISWRRCQIQMTSSQGRRLP